MPVFMDISKNRIVIKSQRAGYEFQENRKIALAKIL